MISVLRNFFKSSSAGGILLALCAVLALIVANTPLYGVYDYVLHILKFRIGFNAPQEGGLAIELNKSVLHWINDGLMAIFFFLVGLEIKRELKIGELSSRARALLPVIAAAGGMAVPALIYVAVNFQSPQDLSGWAIPAATDIAFTLGVMSLLGSRVPLNLKVLLTAIAIIDDLGAIIIIALFYSDNLALAPLLWGGIVVAGLAFLNQKNVSRISPYVILGMILWLCLLKSGVHATIAGVLTAMFVPITSDKKAAGKDYPFSPLKHLEHVLHPWVVFGILPIFAFANAGVPFDGMGIQSLFEPVTLGIILGLFLGKQIGIFTTIWLCIKLKICPMPRGVKWVHIYGVAVLCGIGFTMSLFIGGLAFDDLAHQASIRLGVLVGSVLSAIYGYMIFAFAPKVESNQSS